MDQPLDRSIPHTESNYTAEMFQQSKWLQMNLRVTKCLSHQNQESKKICSVNYSLDEILPHKIFCGFPNNNNNTFKMKMNTLVIAIFFLLYKIKKCVHQCVCEKVRQHPRCNYMQIKQRFL